MPRSSLSERADSNRGDPPADAAFRSPPDDLITRVAGEVDVGSRRDLRRRLADALERVLEESHADAPVLLPSTRTLADSLGIHRKTTKAALQMLVERGVLSPVPGGRYAELPQRSGAAPGAPAPPSVEIPAAEADSLDALLIRAAATAAQQRLSGTQFAALASRAFRRAASGQRRIIFVEPSEDVPGLRPADLAGLLEMPVDVRRLDDLVIEPHVVFVAASPDVAAVRARLMTRADVFAVGLAFDADLRLATANLESNARVSVVADDGVLAGVHRRLGAMRPDLQIELHREAPAELPSDTALILAPESLELGRFAAPVARFRCAISPTELTLLRAKLGGPARSAPRNGDGGGGDRGAVERHRQSESSPARPR